MMPNKTLITIVGVAMIALLLYPPVYNCATTGRELCSQLGAHRLLWEDWMTITETSLILHKVDLTRLALYELALAGAGALIHFLTRK